MYSTAVVIFLILKQASGFVEQLHLVDDEMSIANLSDHMLQLEHMYSSLSAKYDLKLADMDTKLNAVLVTTNAALKTVENNLEATNAELRSVKSDLETKTEQLTNVTRAMAKMESVVGFEVSAGTTEALTITDHNILLLNKVILNSGNGFDKATGIFTSPASGIFLVWVHIFNNDSVARLDVHIYKGSTCVVRAFAPDNTFGAVASATTMFHLAKGERVFFTTIGSSNLFGHDLSSYGGVMLYAD